MLTEETCGAVYEGPTFPEHRGIRCDEPKGHAWPWHAAVLENGEPLHWRDVNQKQLEIPETGR